MQHLIRLLIPHHEEIVNVVAIRLFVTVFVAHYGFLAGGLLPGHS